jgi:hypothetical protein
MPSEWLKSSLSYANNQCVEVEHLDDGHVRMRNSRYPDEAILEFTPAEWDAFLGGVRLGEFDRPA